MKYKKEDVERFTYSGNDDMINFDNDKIPKPHKDFKATLKLKNGKEVKAVGEWRKRIWEWWHEARKEEITVDILSQVRPSNLKRAYRCRV